MTGFGFLRHTQAAEEAKAERAKQMEEFERLLR